MTTKRWDLRFGEKAPVDNPHHDRRWLILAFLGLAN